MDEEQIVKEGLLLVEHIRAPDLVGCSELRRQRLKNHEVGDVVDVLIPVSIKIGDRGA